MSASGNLPKGTIEITIRKLVATDVPAVLAILQESPEAAAWSQESLLGLAAVEPDAWIAELEGVITGFLIGRSAADEFEILNMAVTRAHRRTGIGSRLLAAALEFSRLSGCARAYLEVRASNIRAIALYSRHGFAECGRRARYYSDPTEDAQLLSLALGGTH